MVAKSKTVVKSVAKSVNSPLVKKVAKSASSAKATKSSKRAPVQNKAFGKNLHEKDLLKIIDMYDLPRSTLKKNSKLLSYVEGSTAGSREHMIAVMNREFEKIEQEFYQKIIKQFFEIIENYVISPEKCSNILRDDELLGLGGNDTDKFYESIIRQLFDRADGQHEVDRWHDQHATFYFALFSKQDSFYD
jgi:hypothetical protein